jgi:predicted amidophosphoribosyltransferase
MSSDPPLPPVCPECGQPLKFVKAVPHLGTLPELFVFYCSHCKQAETKVQQQSAACPPESDAYRRILGTAEIVEP